MKSSRFKRYTVSNNINATHHVLCAIVESGLDIHLIHLGTMGVYGYGSAGIRIPEGYLDIEVRTDSGKRVNQQILYPTNPGSVYHMTKSLDQLLFHYYNKNDRLMAVDHPPELGERVLIMNQMTETRRVIDLARYVSELTGSGIVFVSNPRKEANRHFISKGLVPVTLNEGLLKEVTDIAKKYAHRADHSTIPAMSTWTREQRPGSVPASSFPHV